MKDLKFWRELDIEFCRENANILALGGQIGSGMMGRGVVYVTHGHHSGGGMQFDHQGYKFTSYFYPLERLQQVVKTLPPGLEKMVSEYVVESEFIVFFNHDSQLPRELSEQGVSWSSVYRFRTV